jgi:hypothetical protein
MIIPSKGQYSTVTVILLRRIILVYRIIHSKKNRHLLQYNPFYGIFRATGKSVALENVPRDNLFFGIFHLRDHWFHRISGSIIPQNNIFSRIMCSTE